jgi:hypothetical protein
MRSLIEATDALDSKQGFGRVNYPTQPHNETWEPLLRALSAFAMRKRIYNMDEFRHAIERVAPRSSSIRRGWCTRCAGCTRPNRRTSNWCWHRTTRSWQRWLNAASLTLLAALRHRAPEAIDWAGMPDVIPVLDAFEASMESKVSRRH